MNRFYVNWDESFLCKLAVGGGVVKGKKQNEKNTYNGKKKSNIIS